jgi:hypothetical protein
VFNPALGKWRIQEPDLPPIAATQTGTRQAQ